MSKILFVLICCGLDIYGKPIAHNTKNNNRKYGNPEEHGPYLEGDLLFPMNGKNGIKSVPSRWKNGEIPFEIRGSYSEL